MTESIFCLLASDDMTRNCLKPAWLSFKKEDKEKSSKGQTTNIGAWLIPVFRIEVQIDPSSLKQYFSAIWNILLNELVFKNLNYTFIVILDNTIFNIIEQYISLTQLLIIEV